jgi:hypothetical protein
LAGKLHLPLVHASVVHTFLSLQSALPAQLPPQPMMGDWLHAPVAELQASAVHGWLSSQFLALPGTHAPAEQASPCVQALPSVQAALLFGLAQAPVEGAHTLSVHTLPSSQFCGWPATHCPLAHASPTVHWLPSSQLAAIAGWSQVPFAHASAVHALPSLQSFGGPPVHLPPAQASPTVQALPSSQAPVVAAKAQSPLSVRHVSDVHGLSSLHALALPGTHLPSLQASPAVQALLSLHGPT